MEMIVKTQFFLNGPSMEMIVKTRFFLKWNFNGNDSENEDFYKRKLQWN